MLNYIGMRRGACWLGLTALFLFAFGCGGGSDHPDTIGVNGQIKYNGQPLKKGKVTFSPVTMAGSDTLARPATGDIDENGNYTVGTFETGDGVVPGKYKVVVVSYSKEPTAEEIDQGAKYESAIPEKYSSAMGTDLDVTVTADGDNPLTLNFDLKD